MRNGNFSLSEMISRIRETRRRLFDAIKDEHDCCIPLMSDYRSVTKVYSLFEKLMKEHGEEIACVRDKQGRTHTLTLFIMIVQLLYAPRSLYGGKWPMGLRGRVADVTGLNKGRVSQLSRGTVRMYEMNLYGFADDTDILFREIVARMM